MRHSTRFPIALSILALGAFASAAFAVDADSDGLSADEETALGTSDSDTDSDALGRMTQAADDDSIVNFTYDSLSRVLTEQQGSNPLGSTGKTVSYTWNAESERTKVTYPSGFEARETRDDLGRTTEIKDQSNVSVATFARYGAGGRLKTLGSGNGMTGTWTYDGFRRPTDIAHKTSGNTERAGFEYGWDANDNPTYEERRHISGTGDVYTYDKANRLTKVLRDVADPSAEVATPNSQSYDKKLEYDMDDVFNLTSYKTTPYGGSTTTTSYTTNAMNEYTAVGGVTHAYTDNGALKDDNVQLYKYDGHDRLIEVRLKSGNTLVATYAYDAVGLGRRTKKVVGSDTTRYINAGVQQVEELDGSNALLRLFVFGDRIDQVVMMEAPDQADVDGDSNASELVRLYFHGQLIGSVTHVTAAAETVVESYRYDPYGALTIKDAGGSTVSVSALGNDYTFTARQWDAESAHFHYRARQYSAGLRRFVYRDPLEYIDGPNVYALARSRPTVMVDPTGTKCSGVCDGDGYAETTRKSAVGSPSYTDAGESNKSVNDRAYNMARANANVDCVGSTNCICKGTITCASKSVIKRVGDVEVEIYSCTCRLVGECGFDVDRCGKAALTAIVKFLLTRSAL